VACHFVGRIYRRLPAIYPDCIYPSSRFLKCPRNCFCWTEAGDAFVADLIPGWPSAAPTPVVYIQRIRSICTHARTQLCRVSKFLLPEAVSALFNSTFTVTLPSFSLLVPTPHYVPVYVYIRSIPREGSGGSMPWKAAASKAGASRRPQLDPQPLSFL
jgi:hypothetical protein